MRISHSLALVGSLQFGVSGPVDCHVYALRGPAGIVLIDAGGGTHTEQILANVQEDLGPGRVETLILTHCHPDHCGGAADVRVRTECCIIAPEPSRDALEAGDEQATGLRAARAAGIYPPGFRLSPCKVAHVFQDGENFEAAGLRFTAIHVRGHSRDSFCLLAEVEGVRALFSGDVVFYGGVLGLINAEGSEMSGYRADLGKLANLAVEGLFPGHGLFTVRGGQRHLDCAIAQARQNFVARQIGQWDLIF